MAKRTWEQISKQLKQYVPVMKELGIPVPDLNDPSDIHRALFQLRQRLSVDLKATEDGSFMPDYSHKTNLGLMPLLVDEMSNLRQVANVTTQADLEILQRDEDFDISKFTEGFQDELGFFFDTLRNKTRENYWLDPDNLLKGLITLISQPGLFGDEHVDSIRDRFARLNPRRKRRAREKKPRRAKRNPGKRQNPLNQSEANEVAAYLATGENEAQVQAMLAGKASAARDLDLSPSRVGAIFPRTGTLQRPDSWGAKERIPAALESYDLVTRAGAPDPVPENLRDTKPFSSDASLRYITDTMGISLNEAKYMLTEMKRSAEGPKNMRGERVAMQPSSALCKLYRTRKLPFRPSPNLMTKVGVRDVLILMSPDGEKPRVMTWRRGTHIDCDMVGNKPSDLFTLLSRALQSALLWISEKDGRTKNTNIYVGQVGQTGVFHVWGPGDTLSITAIGSNLQAARTKGFSLEPLTSSEAKSDAERYAQINISTFGTKGPRASRSASREVVEEVRASAPVETERPNASWSSRRLKAYMKEIKFPNYTKFTKKEDMLAALGITVTVTQEEKPAREAPTTKIDIDVQAPQKPRQGGLFRTLGGFLDSDVSEDEE